MAQQEQQNATTTVESTTTTTTTTTNDLRVKLAVVFQRAQTSVAWQKQCVQDVPPGRDHYYSVSTTTTTTTTTKNLWKSGLQHD